MLPDRHDLILEVAFTECNSPRPPITMQDTAEMPDPASFVFATCQIGAEQALKREIAREWPDLRFAFSRSGFLTFKIPPATELPGDFGSKLAFARATGFCLGAVSGSSEIERADSVWRLIGERPVSDIHVWPRDRFTPGFRDYEPGMTGESIEIENLIRAQAASHGRNLSPSSNLQFAICNLQSFPESKRAGSSVISRQDPPCPPLRRGGEVDVIADVIIVTPDEWWVGYHRVHSIPSSWPGGFCAIELPPGAVSRAWLKMCEAVLWSGFRLKAGQRCLEIGAAPGGASQYLLSCGLDVIGVDPAEMDPAVIGNPNFRHIRKRAKEVPRKEFVGVDWLTSDVNLPPNYTLDAVKAIVQHSGVRLIGMLLTLKLVDWSLADEVPKYLERIRSWGFREVRARQLHHNRQEICVAASGFKIPGAKPLHAAGGRFRRGTKSSRKDAKTQRRRDAAIERMTKKTKDR